MIYSSSNPLTPNVTVLLFSVTMRTTCSGAPSGMVASISSVTFDSIGPGQASSYWADLARVGIISFAAASI